MMDFLRSFKSLIKLEQIRTDNNVFKLHYKITVIMLIVFSILLTSKQYFGDPIQCTASTYKDVVESLCWITGTFINKDTLNNTTHGSGINAREKYLLMGLGPERRDGELIWQKYYQWVCIVFCFQALLFYMPRYLWKSWEGGRLRLLVKDFNGPLVTPNWNNATKQQLIHYLLSARHVHQIYAFRYAVCEALNLANVILQVFLMDWFLTGQFVSYGYNVLFNPEMTASQSMTQVFPKLTKCLFINYGPSGSMQKLDFMCVLSLNNLNEKLFLILWCWFLTLFVVTSISLIYRLLVVFLPKARIYLLMAQARYVGMKQIALIVRKLSYGDFFVLYHVGKNVNPIIFRELILCIYDNLNAKVPYHSSARIGTI